MVRFVVVFKDRVKSLSKEEIRNSKDFHNRNLNRLPENLAGTVICHTDGHKDVYVVDWDEKFTGSHTCNRKISTSTGYNVPTDVITPHNRVLF